MYDSAIIQGILKNWTPKSKTPSIEVPAIKLPTENQHVEESESVKLAEKNSVIELPTKNQRVDEKRRREVTPPPNCYVDGVITANFGEFTYRQVYKYTHIPLEIKKDGGRYMPCSKCSITREFKIGLIGKNMKAAACSDCRRNGGFTYLDFCNATACYIRGNLYRKGLDRFIDWLNLGYDREKRALIFPLNDSDYIELPFNGRDYTASPKEIKAVLMHYNVDLGIGGAGGFKANETAGCGLIAMPYLDNRFYGVDGRTVIAINTCKNALLPFPTTS